MVSKMGLQSGTARDGSVGFSMDESEVAYSGTSKALKLGSQMAKQTADVKAD
jgi:hypothetical protein